MEKKTSGFGSKLGGALKKGALVGGVALAGVGIAGLKMASDFESSLAEVRTLLPDISDTAFGELEKGVLQFSKDMGIATSEAIPALYQAISAGVPPENVLDFMQVAAKAAVGGVTDLETAVDGVTSVVNAYGADVIDAQKASDIMFTAVKLGKTDFDQLSRSLFQVIPTAASLGISFEEVAAEMAVLTAQGVPTAVAATQLRAAFVEASKGGTKLDSAIKELTDKSFADLIKEGKTGADIFELLRGSMPEQEFKDLFGSVEAMNAVLAITGPNAEKTQKALDDTGASAGAVDTAFETIEKTASRKLAKAINILKVELTKLGLKVLPLVSKALSKLIPFLEKNIPKAIVAIQKGFRTVRPFIEAFVDVVKTIAPPFLKLTGTLLKNKDVMLALGIAVAAVLVPAFIAWAVSAGAAAVATLLAVAPILAVVAAIALLAFGIIQLIKNFDKIVAFFKKVPGIIKSKFLDVFENVKGFLFRHWKEALIFILTGPIGLVVFKFRDEIKNAILKFGKKALNFVLEPIKSHWKEILITILTGPIGLVVFKFRDKIVSALEGIIEDIGRVAFSIGREVIDAIASGIDTGLFIIKGAINSVIGLIESGINFFIRGLNNLAAGIGDIAGAINDVLGFFGGPKIPKLPKIPEVTLPRLQKGAFPIPRDLVALLEKGEIVIPRRQADVVRASRITPFPTGMATEGSRDFNANISVGSEREATQQLELMLRRLAFSTGAIGA